MSEAGLTPEAAAQAAHGVADTGVAGAGFISKQTPMEVRAGQTTDKLPAGALSGAGARPPVHKLQPEGEGPDVLMGPLRQQDPEERLSSIADAQADTEIAAAKAHAAAVKSHGHN